MSRYHWRFNDPAQAKGTEEEIYAEFRRVRDEIKMVFNAYAAGLREGANLSAARERESCASCRIWPSAATWCPLPKSPGKFLRSDDQSVLYPMSGRTSLWPPGGRLVVQVVQDGVLADRLVSGGATTPCISIKIREL